jgi:uncharacterized protein Smg (DUF494 family)
MPFGVLLFLFENYSCNFESSNDTNQRKNIHNIRTIGLKPKKIMKTLFTIAALLIASSSFATEKPLNVSNKMLNEVSVSNKFEFNMYRLKGTMNVRLFLNQKESNRITVKLMDAKGNVLFQETTSEKGTTGFNFDISNLMAGNYQFELTNGFETVTKKLTVSETKAIDTITINQ